MDNITTNLIVDPNIQQGFTGYSLAFLQNANKTVASGLAQSIIGESYDSTKAYVLEGLQPYGTNQYHTGFVLWQNEVFYCPGKTTTTAFSHSVYLDLNTYPDPTADPCPFSDGTGRNVHYVRQLAITDATSGDILLSTAIYIHAVPTWTNATLLNSWTTPSSFQFIKDGNNVSIRGRVSNTGSILSIVCQLPVGYRPTLETCTISAETGAVDNIHTGTIDTSGNVTLASLSGASNKNLIFYLTFTTL